MTGKRSASLALIVFMVGFALACSTSAPLRRYARAQQLEREGSYAAALRVYEQVLPKIPPQDRRWRSELYYHMGECFYRQDRAAEAYGAYQKAADADSANFKAHLRLGEMFLSAGALDRASEQAALVLNSAGSNIEAQA